MKKEINVQKAIEAYKAYITAYQQCSTQSAVNWKDALDAFDATASKLTATIGDAQGRSRERTVNVRSVIADIILIEKELSLPKKALDGVRIVSRDINAQKFPRAYKYVPKSTKYDAYYKNGSWRITDISRETCTQNPGDIILTPEAEEGIIKATKGKALR